MRHERFVKQFAERAEARLEEMADRLERDAWEVGIDGAASGMQARELGVVALMAPERASERTRRSLSFVGRDRAPGAGTAEYALPV